MELSSYFKGLLGRVEPQPEYVNKAKAAHEKVREQLKGDPEVGEAHLDTFLSGSYVRHTALQYIKDVDIVCVVNIDWTVTEPGVTLAWLQQSLQKYYTVVTPQGRSVYVKTPDDVELDIVPGAPVSRVDGPLRIPDRDVKNWVLTHPRAQIKFSEEHNARTGGYYKPLVKIAKFWRDRLTNENARPKSYVLEVLTSKGLSFTPTSHAAGFAQALEAITDQCGPYAGAGQVPEIPDPGYPTVNVAKRWTLVEFRAFLAQLRSAAKIARTALNSTDQDESVKLWRSLFGSKFAPPDS